MQLNSLSPLGAYKYFLRGYTRPARYASCTDSTDGALNNTLIRYIDGVVKSEHFTLPANFPYQPLRMKVDPELVEFFEGFEYRWDIIERIDLVVRAGIRELSLCRSLPPGYRRLICYAVWGNPSDAYKWYEYQFQDEYLPHRYLPEHVVLGHVPKLAGEADPQPSCLTTSKRHKDVRCQMARANDEGIGKEPSVFFRSCFGNYSLANALLDVLEVLMTEFKAALIRRGFRRVDIDSNYDRAKESLETERQDPTGKSYRLYARVLLIVI